jgi:hypothetical protein
MQYCLSDYGPNILSISFLAMLSMNLQEPNKRHTFYKYKTGKMFWKEYLDRSLIDNIAYEEPDADCQVGSIVTSIHPAYLSRQQVLPWIDAKAEEARQGTQVWHCL